MKPYYEDADVRLYHGDCREITEWLAADVLVIDPPYGRGWKQGGGVPNPGRRERGRAHGGIVGDLSTEVRDACLAAWGTRPGIVFGDLMLAPPAGTKLVGVYRKPPDAGVRGAIGGRRRDAEALYWTGRWPSGLGGRSSIVETRAGAIGNPHSPAGRTGHPHAKPLDVMEQLIDTCPPGVIADPFAGSGSTLVAARNLGRKAIGVELEERYCEVIARRLSQAALPLHAGDPS